MCILDDIASKVVSKSCLHGAQERTKTNLIIGFKISIQNGKLTTCSWHTLVKVLPLEPHTGSKIPGQTSGHPGKNVQNSGNNCSFGGNAVFVKTELMI